MGFDHSMFDGPTAPKFDDSKFDAPALDEDRKLREQLAYLRSPERRDVSKTESAARGFGQGVTFDFGDELAGAARSLFGDETYTQARDQVRKSNAMAREQNPWSYGIGQVAGGLATAPVMPGGAVASLGRAVATGAAMGAASGLGASEADLTKGDFLSALRDTAVGTAIGGAAGAGGYGLGKLIANAPKRVDRRDWDVIRNAATPEQRALLDSDDAFRAAKDAGVLGKSGKEGLQIARDASANETKAAQKIFDAADTALGGDDATALVTKLEGVRAKLASNPGAVDKAAKVEKLIERVKSQWVPDAPAASVSGREMLADITKGAGAKAKEKIGAKADDFVELISRRRLGDLRNDPSKFATKVNESLNDVGAKIGEWKSAVQALDNSAMPGTDIMKALHAVEKTYRRSPAGKEIADGIAKKIETAREWIQKFPVEKNIHRVPLKSVDEFVQDLGKQGFAGSPFDQAIASKVQKQLWGAVKDSMDSHMDRVVKARGFVGRKLARIGDIKELNREYSLLAALDTVAKRRAAVANVTGGKAVADQISALPKSGKVSLAQARELADSLKGEAQAAVNEFVDSGLAKAVPGAPAKMAEHARRSSALSTIGDVMERGIHAPHKPPVTGMDAVVSGLGMAAGGPAGALGAFATKAALQKGAPRALQGLDRALAKLVQSARAGTPIPDLVTMGTESGLPRPLVDRIIGSLAQPATATAQ